MGGLPRRNTVVASSREKGPTVALDAGDGLAPPPPLDRPVRPGAPMPAVRPPPSAEVVEQRRIKAALIAGAYAAGGIDGMALGANDWTLGAPWVLETVKQHGLPILAANLTCGGSKPFPGGKVVDVGGRRIGVVGVTAGAPEGCEVGDPVDALRGAVTELGTVDFTVALTPLPPDVLAKVGAAGLPIHVLLPTGGRSGTAVPYGNTTAFEAGTRGKEMGVMTLTFTPGATAWKLGGQEGQVAERLERTEQRLTDVRKRKAATTDPEAIERLAAQEAAYAQQLTRDREILASMEAAPAGNILSYRQIQLGTDVADHAATAALVAAAKTSLEASEGRADPMIVPHRMPAGSAFAGSDTCATCHRAEHAQWAGTGHSHAYSTLNVAKRTQDPECWSCHVTAANQPGGPTEPANVGPFRDVQCETCHGPGAAHVTEPQKANIVRSPDPATCTTCHDGDRDGGRFDPARYWPQIVHGPTGATRPAASGAGSGAP